jgi:hypothetical protein
VPSPEKRPFPIGNQALLHLLGGPPSRPDLSPSPTSVIRRQCSCGSNAGGECDACKKEKEETVLRKAAGAAPAAVPGIVHQVLRSPGQPLPGSVRTVFESRFGRSFQNVRVHIDASAALSARALQAQAYAVGSHIVFGEGGYAPHATEGRRLLAHELAHVAQQGGASPPGVLRVGDPHDPAEHEADRAADAVMSGHSASPAPGAPAIRRTVVVSPVSATPQIAADFEFLCPGKFTAAGPNITGTCNASTTASCDCLCDVVNDATRTYTIDVADAVAGTAPATLFDGSTVTVPTSTVFPTTTPGPNPSIHMPSTASSVEFGSFNSSSRGVWAPFWRILAHELCGHARLNQTYAGGTGKRPGHDSTIDTENLIAGEHGEPPRGHFADKPRQGESFLNPVGDRSKVVFFLTDGEHFEAP